MLLLILSFPLIAACISLFFGRFLSNKGVTVLTTLSVFFSFIISLVSGFEVFFYNASRSLTLSVFLQLGAFSTDWAFILDPLAVTMLIIVTFISFLVHVYSCDYMAYDPHKARFFSFLSLFTFFMLILVCASDLFLLFFSWEGVGLCSYLLVGFWFTRTQANVSAIKAFIINRVGDLGFLLGLFAIITATQTCDFIILPAFIPFLSNLSIFLFGVQIDFLSCLLLFLFCGTMSKSAQIFLHTWLPDAMEGPTPVSALIHAATMVAAGVFLLVRCSSLLLPNSPSANLIILIGASTAFFASTVGFFQNDVKKIVAYSTCSQLGYMVAGVGLCAFSGAFFHLVNHAFFKALLFLSCGALIHSLNDQQDIRKAGNLVVFLPFTYFMFFVGSLALSGFPFFSGFYSKDFLIESALFSFFDSAFFSFCLLFCGALITVLYSFKLIALVFFGQSAFFFRQVAMIKESSIFILAPLFFLAFFSIVFGFWFNDFFSSQRFVIFNFFTASLDIEFLSAAAKSLPVLLIAAGAYFFLFFHRFPILNNFFSTLAVFFTKKWMFDQVFNFFVASKLFSGAYNSFLKSIDKGFFEFIGPFFLQRFLSTSSKTIKNMQTGFLPHYFSFFLFATVIVGAALSFPALFIAKPFILVSLVFMINSFNDFGVPFDLQIRNRFSVNHLFNKVVKLYISMFFLWAVPLISTMYFYTLNICFLVFIFRYKTMPLAHLFT